MRQMRSIVTARLCGPILLALALARSASAQNVLLIWDVNDLGTQNLASALQGAGMTVTLSATSQTNWNGTNPSTSGFCAVIHLNGTTYAQGMPASGQAALVSFVQGGGGYLGGEWNAYDLGLGLRTAMRDLILFDRTGGRPGPLTYSDVPAQAGHPILANVPPSFNVPAAANIGPVHTFGVNPATVLMTDEFGSDAVAVRNFGLGRVVNFNHAGNYDGPSALSNPNVEQLYIDAIRFACGCGNGALDAGEECDDGNTTNGDGCSSRCTIEPCNPACNDGVACTDDVCQFDSAASAFVCLHTPVDAICTNGNSCLDGRCDPVSGCFTTPDDANTCEDGNACTVGDHCSGGTCVPGGPRDCNDFNPCTDDLCNSASGCFTAPNSDPCDDHNACTDNDHCNFGFCSGGTFNSNPCDDGNPCSVNDHCTFGFCGGGTPRDCNDHNPCTTEFCQFFVGCVFTNLDGIQCNDNDPCTTDDFCHVGHCTGDPRNCFDDDPCTIDSCSSAGGAFLCMHESCTSVAGSSCDSMCLPAECGNGRLDPGEGCDPPDPTPVPGRPGDVKCRPDCTSCGDGVVQAGHGETCDDGNGLSGCTPGRPAVPIDACQNVCTPPICRSPSKIKVGSGQNTFSMRGWITPVAPAVTIDPHANDFAVELTDTSGAVVFRSSLDRGLILPKGATFRYSNRAAKVSGGVSKLQIRTHGGEYLVTLTAYGNLSAATDQMSLHVFVGAQEWTLSGRWIQSSHGWKLDLPSTFQGG